MFLFKHVSGDAADDKFQGLDYFEFFPQKL